MSDDVQPREHDPLEGLDRKLRAQLRKGEQPTRIEPQLATAAGGEPGSEWFYEQKFDGVRLLAFVRDGEVRLRTRKHVPVDDAFPELTAALRDNARSNLVVDGEVVALNGDATSFSRLQGRLGLGLTPRGRPRPDPGRGPHPGQGSRVPVCLYLFDLLSVDGHDLRQLPLRARKQLLVNALHFEEPLRYSDHWTGAGEQLLEEACRAGWEGLIAKDPEAPYRAGRSRRWRKLACERGQELVVGGFTEPSQARGGFGALLLGYHDDQGRLRYAGKVGTGFDDAMLETLDELLRGLGREDAPFIDPPADREANWVDPHIVVQVSFSEWTDEGRLRQPRFCGLRIDLDPSEVVREPLG
jgi:bifunctional non-homologous end joining protein LigD